MKQLLRKILLIAFCLFISLIFIECKTNSSASRQKQVEKQREQKDEEVFDAYNNAKEKHLKNQSRETRKRMKKNEKKSGEKGYLPKKECFLKRWFSRKPNTCPKS